MRWRRQLDSNLEEEGTKMSTERAPREDLEGRLQDAVAGSTDTGMVAVRQDDVRAVLATLRDLSRKLERAERAEAALEEARRERDEVRQHVSNLLKRVPGGHVSEGPVYDAMAWLVRALSPQPQEPATEGEEGTP